MTRWFRMYTNVVHDPKVQKLAPRLFKTWVNLLCIAGQNEGKLPPLSDLSFMLHLSEPKIEIQLKELEAAGLIDDGRPHNWNSRQFKSDVSTARVKRFRERSETVSETPSEQNRTDTEQKQSRTELKRKRRLSEDFKPSDKDLAWATGEGFHDVAVAGETAQFVDHWVSKGETRLDWSRTWKNWMRNSRKFAGRNGRRGAAEKCLRGAGHPAVCQEDGCRFE